MFHEEIQSIESDKDETDVTDKTIEEEEFFETTERTATWKLEDVLPCLIPHFESELSTPPSPFTVQTFLTSSITDRTDSYSDAINAAARYAINNMETFQILGNILWCRIASLFEQHLADNQGRI
jgi:hypothetical protein